MTIAERYSRAATSSHLKLKVEAGDVDVVIAAGLADSLGTTLLRCRLEWDSQQSQVQQAIENRLHGLGIADAVKKAAKSQDDADKRAAQAGAAEEMRLDVERAAITARMLVLMRMGSLEPAAAAAQRFALQRVARRNLHVDPVAIERVVKAALDVWLDQRCHACAGRGFSGGYGSPIISCRACRASGKRRRVFPAKTAHEFTLGEWLMAEFERMVEAASKRMNQSLR